MDIHKYIHVLIVIMLLFLFTSCFTLYNPFDGSVFEESFIDDMDQGRLTVINDIKPPTAGNNGIVTTSNITPTSCIINWTPANDNLTAQQKLLYQIVFIDYVDANTLELFNSVDFIETSGTVVKDWSAGINTCTLDGLTESTSYVINVLVKDEAGNTTSYNARSVTTNDSSYPVIGLNGKLVINSVTDESLTLHWSNATDDITDSSMLQYAVYISDSPNIDEVTSTMTNGVLVQDWQQDLTGCTITGLTESQTYYINVLVKDESGNISPYMMQSVVIIDSSYPVPGQDGAIGVSSVTTNSLVVNWSSAVDDTTIESNLQYALYLSDTANIDNVTNVLGNGTLVQSWQPGLTGYTITGLTESTTYYINVLVKDEAENISAYLSRAVTTTDSSYPAPGLNGALGVSAVTANSLTLSWVNATDDITEINALSYAVYMSTRANIDEVTNIVTNGTVVKDWSANLTTIDITGLSEATDYYFNVLVKDGNGKISSYAMQPVTTLDLQAPVPGNMGAMTYSILTKTDVELSWQAASDNYSQPTALMYRVYRSLSANMDTLTDVATNGTPVTDWTGNLTTTAITDLPTSDHHYFTVVVRDESLNEVLYQTLDVAFKTILTPTEDAYTRAGSYSNLNFGGESRLLVKDALDPEVTRNAFIKFDLSGYAVSDIGQAVLRLYVVESEIGLVPPIPRVVNLYYNDDTSWQEMTVTHNTRPATNGYLTCIEADLSAGRWYDFVITDFIRSRAGTSAVSLEMMSDGQSNYILEQYNSREGANPPQLVIEHYKDQQAPLPGNAGQLTTSGSIGTSATINWADSSDNKTTPDNMRYQVYYATTNNLDTIEGMLANGTLFEDGSFQHLQSVTMPGLLPDTTYYFNVMVLDEAGNQCSYNSVSFTTGYSYTTIGDTQIRGGSFTSALYGDYQLLYCMYDDKNPLDEERQMLFKFDVSAYSQPTVSSAYLRFFVLSVDSGLASRDIAVYGNSDTSWDEATIHWKNAPDNDIFITNDVIVGEYRWVDIDVTSYVNSNLVNNKISLHVINTSANALYSLFKVYAKESKQYHPELVLNP